MSDPYQTLNISPGASDDEVKKAYRELARKYHPDNYHDNPLADLAQEKMKEINAAYDLIQKQRSGRASSGGYAQHSPYQQSRSPYTNGGYSAGGAGSVYQRVRMAINRNDLAAAEQLLASVQDQNAEWNFLKGTICYRRGWLDEARRYYQVACRMDPGNMEYRQALSYMESGQEAYRPEGYEVFTSDCVGGNMCGRLACMYLMCNACGCGGMRFFYC